MLTNLFRGGGISRKWGMEFELRGLCMMYACIDSLERKDRLKVSYRLGEISREEYHRTNRDIELTFESIYRKYGAPLFARIKNVGLDKLSAAARQNVVTGLYQLSDVCVRANRRDEAREICEFAIRESPSFMAESFKNRVAMIAVNGVTSSLGDRQLSHSITRGEPRITFGPGDRYVTP